MSEANAIRAAADHAGGTSALARMIGGRVLRQHVEYWIKAGRVPAEHCPSIERITGGAVTCEELNDRVDWAAIRGTAPAERAA